jgi:hypothetical protein
VNIIQLYLCPFFGGFFFSSKCTVSLHWRCIRRTSFFPHSYANQIDPGTALRIQTRHLLFYFKLYIAKPHKPHSNQLQSTPNTDLYESKILHNNILTINLSARKKGSFFDEICSVYDKFCIYLSATVACLTGSEFMGSGAHVTAILFGELHLINMVANLSVM